MGHPASPSQGLSSPQREVWFGQLVDVDAPLYVIGGHVCLQGPIDADVFQRSLELTVQRHDGLRLVLHKAEPLPAVTYAAAMDVPLERVDLSREPDPEDAALRWMERELQLPFAPYGAPFFRFALLKLGPDRWRWFKKYQHVLVDGWAISLIVQQVARAYASLRQGGEAREAAAPSYLEFMREDHDYLRSDAFRRSDEYWTEKFRTIPATAISRKHALKYRGPIVPSRWSTLLLDRTFYTRLEHLAAACDRSVVHILLAAIYIYFTRIGGHDELAVGMLSLNRRTAAHKQTIGMFTKMIPARFRFGSGVSVRALAGGIAAELRRDYRHQRFPISEINRRAGVQSLGRSQLFDITLSFEKHSHDATFEGHPARTIGMSNGYEQNALALFLREFHAEGDVHLDFHYNLAAFEPSEIDRLKQRIACILEQMLAAPDREIRALAIMPDEEAERVLTGVNDSRVELPPGETIVSVLERRAAQAADRIAIRTGSLDISYDELSGRANQLARLLVARGVGVESLVGVCLNRSDDLLVALLGVLKAGGAFVPLDPSYPAARRALVAADASPVVIITSSSAWTGESDSPLLALDLERAAMARQSRDNLQVPIPAGALAYVNYTSGSTGRPKGVMVSHANVVNLFAAMDRCLGTAPATWLALTSISFDISVLELLWTLGRGSTVVLAGDGLDLVSRSQSPSTHRPLPDMSLFYFASEEGPGRGGDKYRLLLDGARLADERGFAAVWTPERHFHAFGGLYPNPVVTGAAVAAITRRVQVRAGSVVLPLHDPIRVAEEWAVVDNLSGGRVGISFASGWQTRDFVFAPDRYPGRKQRMVEDIEVVRRLWRGETISRPGVDGRVVEVRSLPRPIQPELPVWVTAAGDPETFRTAGEIGANLLTHLLGQTERELSRKIQLYRSSYREHAGGHGASHVTLMLHAFAGTSRELVRDAVRMPFRQYLRSSVSLMANVAQSLGIDLESGHFRERDLEAVLDHAVARYFETSALFGTVDDCRDTLERLTAIGVDEVALLIDFGVEHQAAMESLDLFSELVADRATRAPRGESFAELVRRQGVTHLQCTPSMAGLFAGEGEAAKAVGSLECLVLGGEELPMPLAQALRDAIPARIYNMYGPTETTVWSTCHPIEARPSVVPIGRPVANTSVYILDADMRLLPPGVVGELYIGGHGVARGYLGRPDRTAEQFLPDPFGTEPGGRLYRTADLAMLRPDGSFEFAGRADNQLKIRGHRVEPGEVESVLRTCRDVAQAVVVAAPEPGGSRRLVAFVVPHAGCRPSPGDLRRFAQACLPSPFVPADYVLQEALPLTPNGKIDRRALEQAAATLATAAPEHGSAPFGPEEEILAELWRELLGRRPVSRRERFFEAGGHSLLAMRLARGIREFFGVDVPLRLLFEEPSVGGLAAYVKSIRTPGRGTTPIRIGHGARGLPRLLSFSQQRLWFLEQLAPGRSTYNVPACLIVTGPLEIEALRHSVSEVVRRHDVLRSRYPAVADDPAMVIDPEGVLDIPVIDLMAEPHPEAAMRRLAMSEAARPFDLERGPMLRTHIYRLSAGTHALMLTMHHIVSDGYWSMAVMLREVSGCYDAIVAGRTVTLPALPVQYADYAIWQRQRLGDGQLDAGIAYWRERLRGCPHGIELPCDRPRPALPSGRGAELAIEVPAELGFAARNLAQGCGATVFMTLSACLYALLARCTGQTDLVVGTAIATRTEPELELLVGLFVNTLPLRVDASGDPSFAQLVERVRQTCLDAYDHSEVPFEVIVDVATADRDLGRSPLFQVMLVLQTIPAGPLEISNLQIVRIPVHTGTAKFDLTWTFEERDGRLGGMLEFNTDIFDRATVERLAESFLTILGAAAAAAETRLSHLPTMSEPDRRLLAALNDTERQRRDQPVHRSIEECARLAPDDTALVAGGRGWTYAELNRRANQLARGLMARGVGRETGVALCLDPSPDQVVGILAVLKAGGFYLPLDPNHPPNRLAEILDDARPALLVTESRLQAQLPDTSVPVLQIDLEWPRLLQQPDEDLDLDILPEQLAYVIYTSGSTGRPRGVGVPHAAVANHMAWMREAFPLERHDRVLQRTPATFDASVWEFLAPLMQGAQLIVADAGTRLDTARLVQTIGDQQITIFQIVPSLLGRLLDDAKLERATSIRQVFAGGEALTPSLVGRFKERLPAELVNLYGPTEACIDVTSWIEDGGTVAIGRPIHNMQVHVLDERLEPVPPGVDGELYIGGVGLARGYLSERELTAERFVPNPFAREPGSRLYCAGDRARVRGDGNLEFLGRSDRQVKIRGCRIEPGDVEEALRAYAGLGDTRVCAQPINGEETLVAYVATGGRVEAASVQAALADALPSYMIPAHIVRVPAWPLLPNGKLDWSALPAPAVRAVAGRSAPAAPRNALEEAVAVVFAEVLELEAVGADDTFFELGGHSLKATKVVARAASRGIELSLTDLFRHGSPARIANAIIGRRFAATPEAGPRGRARSLPIPQPPAAHHAVSHGQRRLWILEHFGEARPYHMCAAFEITGAFDVAALEEAFRGVITRHESLRTRIIDVNGDPRQQIVAHADFAIGRLDVRSDPDPAERVTELAEAFFREPFELAAGPLLRVTDVQLDATRHLMLFCQHHIVSDGASVGVMVRELLARYRAIREGRVPAFAPLPFQYKDYAAWQLEQLESSAAAASRQYWLEIFANPVEPLKLPFDFPPPHVRRQDGRHLRFHIDVEAAGGLSALAGSCGTSLFMALMAAVHLLLYRYTRQREMVLGMPVANRDLPELDDQIGFYVNLLPLRLALKPSMTFADLLGEVTHRASSALEHQAYPFDRLVEDLKPPIDTRRSPLFDVVVVMQNHDAPGFELPGAAVREWPIETGVAKFGLTFEFTGTGEGLDGVLEFNTAWFQPETAARLVQHLTSLIRSALGEPDRPISELSILSDTDVVHGANGPARPGLAPVTETLVERFERHVARQPGAIAVKHDGRQLTYHDLDARAARLASRLVHEHGVGPETIVALLSPRTEAMVVGVLAILKAGGAYLPLDPTDPPERTGHLIERSGATLLLHGHGVPLPPLDGRLASTSLDDAAIPADASRALPRVEPGNLAYVIYTSGSTGEPKGVAVTHASMARLFRATEPLFQFGSGDIWAGFHSLAFDFSVWEIWGALAHGGTLVVVDYDTSRSPDRCAELLAREGVTVLNQTPTAFGAFTKALARHGDPGLALRWVVFGGEALRPSMLAAWWKLDLAVKPRLVNMYGITETTVHTTFREVRPDDAAPGDASVIGVALDDVRMHVLDEAMTPVPPGSAGELYVAGAGVARGYLGDPSRTAERFLADPLSGRAGDRLYRTGDLARWRHDGTLEYLGRNDRQRKIRGFRIELGEIEAELRTHPDVSDALVVLREAADGPALIAYLVSGDAAPSLDSLRSHLGRRLAAHMMPSRFVRVERWPLTANGKIDVTALADAEGERLASAAFVLPETSIERRLAQLWSEALSVEQVSAVDDFFELGGHSISAIKVVQGIRDTFGQAVSLSVVFEYPVLRDLAGYLQSASEPTGDSAS